MKIALVKQDDNSFIAAYDSDFEKVQKLQRDVLLQCDITKPRNYEFHKKYWGLINMVYSNQERYTDINDLREDITIEAGYYTTRIDIHGEIKKKAMSISFASMDEYEFSDLYSKTLDVIIEHFNFEKQLIIDNVEQWF